jgi:ABC-type nitrate/sulfonate/bicarbonate transport system substrate-binding protein
MTTTGYSVLADGLANADLPLKYISGISTSGAFFVARKGSSIESWEDLKGKRLGGSRGSPEYIHMNGSLAREGIKLGKDAEYVNFQGGTDLMLALRNGSIDGGVSYEPLVSEAVLADDAYIVPALQKDLYSASFKVSSGLLAREDFLEEHSDEANTILTEYAKQVDHLAASPQDAKDTYLTYAPGDPKVIEAAIDNVTVTYDMNTSEMRAVGSTLVDSGQQPEDMGEELVDHIDYTFLAKATGKTPAELGEAQ